MTGRMHSLSYLATATTPDNICVHHLEIGILIAKNFEWGYLSNLFQALAAPSIFSLLQSSKICIYCPTVSNSFRWSVALHDFSLWCCKMLTKSVWEKDSWKGLYVTRLAPRRPTHGCSTAYKLPDLPSMLNWSAEFSSFNNRSTYPSITITRYRENPAELSGAGWWGYWQSAAIFKNALRRNVV